MLTKHPYTNPTRVKLAQRIGTKVNMLTILEHAGRNRHKQVLVKCQCDCGKTTIIPWKRIYKGQTKSCGCYKKLHARTHGMSNSPIYHVWEDMKSRCYNPNNVAYKNYGSRGICMCDSWKVSFQAFYDDMNTGYRQELTIDRIDNDGNYSPENCRWVTRQENLLNSRHIKHITIGKVTRTLTEWLAIFGMKRSLYGLRVYYHKQSPEKALTTPIPKTKS